MCVCAGFATVCPSSSAAAAASSSSSSASSSAKGKQKRSSSRSNSTTPAKKRQYPIASVEGQVRPSLDNQGNESASSSSSQRMPEGDGSNFNNRWKVGHDSHQDGAPPPPLVGPDGDVLKAFGQLYPFPYLARVCSAYIDFLAPKFKNPRLSLPFQAVLNKHRFLRQSHNINTL